MDVGRRERERSQVAGVREVVVVGAGALASLPSNEVLQDTPCIFMFLVRAVTRDPGGAQAREGRGREGRRDAGRKKWRQGFEVGERRMGEET